MMKTTIKPSDNNGKRLFEVKEDTVGAAPKHIWARDFLAAFALFYCGMDKEEYAALQDLELQLCGSVNNSVSIWVGDEMYTVQDITQHQEDFE